MNILRLPIKIHLSKYVTLIHEVEQVRCISHFQHSDSKALWKSVKAETNQAKGRGKRTVKKKQINFSFGKGRGEGKDGYLWPGLNADIAETITQRTSEEQIAFEEKKKEELDSKKPTRFRKRDNSTRGWTGGQWGGQRLVPPLDEDENLSQFDGFLLNLARVSHMKNSVGREYSNRAIVAVGNGNGTFGVGMATSSDAFSSSRKARMKALRRLQFIDRYEDRTVYEDMYVNHHRTFMHIRQQPPGYGLRCHRAIITMCKLMGIKDLYVKTYGSTRMLNIVKCFIKALHSQETHQQKADRLGYHVVEYDPLRDNYPVVLASPKNGITKTEPFDEYEEYLNRPLITRVVRRSEGFHNHHWLNIRYGGGQGPPIPNPTIIPEKLRIIKDAEL